MHDNRRITLQKMDNSATILAIYVRMYVLILNENGC